MDPLKTYEDSIATKRDTAYFAMTVRISNLAADIAAGMQNFSPSNLGEIPDVDVPAPNDNDILSWDAASGTWIPVPPPTGGSGSATTIEVNLGATATFRGRFTITDAAISGTSKVLCWQAPGPYTGKGTRADEAELQPVQVITVAPASGTAQVYWQTPPIVVNAPLPGGASLFNLATIVPGLKDPQAIAYSVTRRIGRVRGNIKFSYMVL